MYNIYLDTEADTIWFWINDHIPLSDRTIFLYMVRVAEVFNRTLSALSFEEYLSLFG